MKFEVLPILLLGLFGLSFSTSLSAQHKEEPVTTPSFGWSITEDQKKRTIRKTAPTLISAITPETDEIRVDTDLVLNDILVFDKSGLPVSGLSQNDFKVYEDGEEQQVAVFSKGAEGFPVSLILLIDHSLSQLSHIERSTEAAKVLIDNMKPHHKIAIVTDDVDLLADFTDDKTLLKQRLDQLRDKALSGEFGRSRQYSALMAAVREKCVRDGTRQIVIFQTDGDEFASLRSREYTSIGLTFNEIAAEAMSRGVTVYTVYTGTHFSGLSNREKMDKAESALRKFSKIYASVKKTEDTSGRRILPSYVRSTIRFMERDAASVAEMAERTGGVSQSLEHPDQALSIYEKILRDINKRYVIGYYPSNKERDGRERKVKIVVNGRPDHQIYGRRSYFAPSNAN